jgi:hypothetical protein
MHPIHPPVPARAAQAAAATGFTVFAALGLSLKAPNAADRFADSHREVLFAM